MKNDFWLKNKLTIALVLAGGVLVIAAFVIGAYVAAANTFIKFPEKFWVGDVNVGGLDSAAAAKKLQMRAQVLEQKGLTLVNPEIGARVLPLRSGGQPLFIFDVDASLAAARARAGRAAWLKSLESIFGAEKNVSSWVVVATPQTKNLLQTEFVNLHLNLPAAQNAGFEINLINGQARLTIKPGVTGKSVDLNKLMDDILAALENSESKVSVSIIDFEPEVSTTAATNLLPQATALAEQINAGRLLLIDGKKVGISSAQLIKLLQPRLVAGEAVVRIAPEELKTELGTELAPFEKNGSNATFEYSDRRVTKFVPHQTGVAIDWMGTADALFASLNNSSSTVAVKTKEAEPEIVLSKLNDLGVNELLGSGSSVFSGSPVNRIHNITVGVNALNGLLIAPGETFSLIKALGKIDASGGYLQELVIKENKTQPEFGGGLCQIGTTTFRAAMGAGFPIVERRNHSYQVSYYFENGVSGTDATIYDPKPDFRFLNDTGHWVMLQAQKNGSTLLFSFWGTRDGRVAERTIPKVLSRTPAPPKQTIETIDLPVGKVKCTEKAHAGASTIFTYKVTYPSGEVKKEDFSSYYKPWAEVCLVGVAATSTPAVNTGITAVPPSADVAGSTGN